MAQTEYTIKQFILDQMQRRGNLSARAFAELVDVSPATITKLIDERSPAKPTLEFLYKLSAATKTPLATLVEMVYPDAVRQLGPNPSTVVIAQLIEELPDNLREAVMMILRSRIS